MLIDANKLSEAFDEEGADVYSDYGDGCDWGFSYKLVHGLIARAPVVDAVPVVRCKDCFYYALWPDGRSMNYCDKHKCVMRDNDFCSHGVMRKANNEM